MNLLVYMYRRTGDAVSGFGTAGDSTGAVYCGAFSPDGNYLIFSGGAPSQTVRYYRKFTAAAIAPVGSMTAAQMLSKSDFFMGLGYSTEAAAAGSVATAEQAW
jgi:WD40 repeat protein